MVQLILCTFSSFLFYFPFNRRLLFLLFLILILALSLMQCSVRAILPRAFFYFSATKKDPTTEYIGPVSCNLALLCFFFRVLMLNSLLFRCWRTLKEQRSVHLNRAGERTHELKIYEKRRVRVVRQTTPAQKYRRVLCNKCTYTASRFFFFFFFFFNSTQAIIGSFSRARALGSLYLPCRTQNTAAVLLLTTYEKERNCPFFMPLYFWRPNEIHIYSSRHYDDLFRVINCTLNSSI